MCNTVQNCENSQNCNDHRNVGNSSCEWWTGTHHSKMHCRRIMLACESKSPAIHTEPEKKLQILVALVWRSAAILPKARPRPAFCCIVWRFVVMPSPRRWTDVTIIFLQGISAAFAHYVNVKRSPKLFKLSSKGIWTNWQSWLQFMLLAWLMTRQQIALAFWKN